MNGRPIQRSAEPVVVPASRRYVSAASTVLDAPAQRQHGHAEAARAADGADCDGAVDTRLWAAHLRVDGVEVVLEVQQGRTRVELVRARELRRLLLHAPLLRPRRHLVALGVWVARADIAADREGASSPLLPAEIDCHCATGLQEVEPLSRDVADIVREVLEGAVLRGREEL